MTTPKIRCYQYAVPKVTIDGKDLEVPAGLNLIEAAKLAGAAVPHYCYHPKLSIAGNCRICLVEVEKQPKLQIACNTKVAEGMVVKTTGPKVEEGRQSVLEFILVNHPIDCPICDQAGECKLQDYYMKLDRKPSRMDEEKVQKDKAVRLGPNVTLDMERCILCSRCVRFCQEVAKDDELCFTERGNHTELTSYPGKELDNPYSVNTVDICPVGALTSTDFRFKQRVWLLKTADTICPGCSTGCNVKLWHNKGVAYRLTPRENEAVNQVWMCDEGRFTYKPVNEENRLRHVIVKRDGRNESVRKETAVAELKKSLEGIPGNAILGIGSAEFSNESNYAFLKFLREVLGVKDFVYHAKEVANPSHDDFLISADKNPNRAGVEAMGFKPFSEERRYQAFLALGALPFANIQKIAFEKNRKVALFTTHDVPEIEYADFVFPTAAWAEDEGTYTNRQKLVQKVNPAFPAPGESLLVWQWIAEFAKVWGTDKIRYRHLNHVMADLAENMPALKLSATG